MRSQQPEAFPCEPSICGTLLFAHAKPTRVCVIVLYLEQSPTPEPIPCGKESSIVEHYSLSSSYNGAVPMAGSVKSAKLVITALAMIEATPRAIQRPRTLIDHICAAIANTPMYALSPARRISERWLQLRWR